jgi:uncharacterized protein
MHGYVTRGIQHGILESLTDFPALAILGPRQAGKTTLAQEIVRSLPGAVYLDLERPSDLRKLSDPELFLQLVRSEDPQALVCLDEIQRVPELFPVLRSEIDEAGRNGQFLLLGSASRDLLRQTSESLAGRIRFLELTPFLVSELDLPDEPSALARLWLRGGFPRSYLARNDESSRQWRESFVRSFLEQDIPQLGFNIPAASLRRLWGMLAHRHGQVLNASQLGGALGVSHTTVRSHVDLLTQTFMVRLLAPFAANVEKRLVKSPKLYLRDSGILHALLEIDDTVGLLAHPVCGESWEGFVVEQVLAAWPDWQPSFYRTAAGAEVDLVLTRGSRRVVIECKASTAPTVSRGFWNALNDLKADQAWIIAPVTRPYPLRAGVTVAPLGWFLRQGQP